jgi:hypothetical protein
MQGSENGRVVMIEPEMIGDLLICIFKMAAQTAFKQVACLILAKYLFTGSLKNRSIDNLETQKKYISMKNSQFFNYFNCEHCRGV